VGEVDAGANWTNSRRNHWIDHFRDTMNKDVSYLGGPLSIRRWQSLSAADTIAFSQGVTAPIGRLALLTGSTPLPSSGQDI